MQYTATIQVDHAGATVNNAVATVASSNPAVQIIENTVDLGTVSGAGLISTDTFTFVVNRRYRFNPASLVWTFSGDDVIADTSPIIVSTANTVGVLDQPYTYDVDATDADPGDVLTYSLSTAPSGMTIDPANGLIQWTPTFSGAVDVDVRVTDTTGRNDRQIYLLSVSAGADDAPPTIDAIPAQTVVAGNPLSVTATGTDPEGLALRFGLSGAPAGAAINTTTGALSWTPATSGNTDITVTVSDPGGQSASTTFPVTILQEPVNNAPVLQPIADQTLQAQDILSVDLIASDADSGDLLRFDLSGAPAGVQFDSDAGILRWQTASSDVGNYTFTATVTDAAGDSASDSFNVAVVGINRAPVAEDDRYVIDTRGTVSIPAPGVLENDTDANGDALTAIQTSNTTVGTATLDADGSLLYQPEPAPPITIGLAEQCVINLASNDRFFAVADVDADGDVEIVGQRISGNSQNVITFVDAQTCGLTTVTTSGATGQMEGSSGATLVNLDDDADLEILLPYVRFNPLGAEGFHFGAFNRDGSELWSTGTLLSDPLTFDIPFTSGIRLATPIPADLDGDGEVELIQGLTGIIGAGLSGSARNTGIAVWNGRTGEVIWEYRGPPAGSRGSPDNPKIVDLDLDGDLEMVWHTGVVNADGTEAFVLPTELTLRNQVGSEYLSSAIANFDDDPYPEIIAYDNQNHYMYEHTGALKWQIDRPASNGIAGLTVAELDGDSLPEYLVYTNPAGIGSPTPAIIAYDSDGTQLWSHHDRGWYVLSFRNGRLSLPTAFDFDQDGIDELVVQHPGGANLDSGLYIFSGLDGEIIASVPLRIDPSNMGATTTVADVDADGAAEIIVSNGNRFGSDDQILIYEGLPGNPFPPARPLRNHTTYQPTLVNDDATIPAYPEPHWLIPGLNKFNATPVIPGEQAETVEQFTYVANDGSADSNTANVELTLSLVNAPAIVSNPPLGASPGFSYDYGALATDADFGDVLSWTLVDGPTGMGVDEFGRVSWTPGNTDLGQSFRVQLIVSDSDSNTDTQDYVIAVTPPSVVPDLADASEEDAEATLIAAGLALGDVTRSFSLDVPEGQIISQSIVADADAAAGSFVNIVISLGPPPIWVPNLVGLPVAAAQASLELEGLTLGTTSFANSDSVPTGLIISHTAAANTQVDAGTAVDVLISGGPAIELDLSTAITASGEPISFALTLRNPDGTAVSPLPGFTSNVTALELGLGTAPEVAGSTITTSADTRGAYRLDVAVPGFGNISANFVVRQGLGTDPYYTPVRDFIAQLDALDDTYTTISQALADGDVVALQAAAAELETSLSNIDLVTLSQRNPFAPEQGFWPSYSEAVSAGFAASFGELDSSPALYSALSGAVADLQQFYQTLNPTAGRDDGARGLFLANNVESRLEFLLGAPGTVGNRIAQAERSFVLLSQLLPALTVAGLEAEITALRDAGFLAANGLGTDDTQPAFFSLASLFSVAKIRSEFINRAYLSHIPNLVAAGMVLDDANVLRETRNAIDLRALITGASQSFHVFQRENSVIELESPARDARSFSVELVGPDAYQATVNFLTSAEGQTSSGDAAGLVSNALAAISQGPNGDQAARVNGVSRGCLFSTLSDCIQLVAGNGFPIVHSNGRFPAPVLVIVQDHLNAQIYIGVYAFFPQERS